MRKIAVRKRKEIVAYALVDDDDYELVSQYSWYLGDGYARHRRELEGRAEARLAGRKYTKKETISMHRLVMGMGSIKVDPVEIDHIDSNRLNNQKANLRPAPDGTNNHNKPVRKSSGTGIRGVKEDKRYTTKQWAAYGTVNGKHHYLGYYHTKEEAGEVAHQWRVANMSHYNPDSYQTAE